LTFHGRKSLLSPDVLAGSLLRSLDAQAAFPEDFQLVLSSGWHCLAWMFHQKFQKVDKIVVSLEVVGFPGPFALATRSLD